MLFPGKQRGIPGGPRPLEHHDFGPELNPRHFANGLHHLMCMPVQVQLGQ